MTWEWLSDWPFVCWRFFFSCMNSLVCIPLFSNWYVNACLYQPMVSGLPISFGNLSLDLHNYAKLILSTAPSPAHCAFIFSKNSNFHGMKLFELIAWDHSALGCVIHWEGGGKGRLPASITPTWSWRWWKGSLLARSLLQAQGPDLGWGRACQGEHAGGKKICLVLSLYKLWIHRGQLWGGYR